MKVEVIKSSGGYWYSTLTGSQFDVKEKNHSMYHVVVGDDIRLIHEFHCKEVKKDSHYDNSNGSLYKFATEQGLNAYEFDLIKRIVRCRKKGQFKEDLDKTKRVIDLYLKEHDPSSLHSRRDSCGVQEADKTDDC